MVFLEVFFYMNKEKIKIMSFEDEILQNVNLKKNIFFSMHFETDQEFLKMSNIYLNIDFC